MNSRNYPLIIRAALGVAVLSVSLTVCAQIRTFTTLSGFNGTNGSIPGYGPLIQGADGNLYGTTETGGWNNGGVVFQVTPSGRLTDIYQFCLLPYCPDGANPEAGLILGVDGDLYGTSAFRGAYGEGTVFKVAADGGVTALHNFCAQANCTDGSRPIGALLQASNGNFYGTTAAGGAYGYGAIFELTPVGAFKTLYSFCPQGGECEDGGDPDSSLSQGADGILYGTTNGYGAHGRGTVFGITTDGAFRTLYSFCAQTNCSDGANPSFNLTVGPNGSIYGTTILGGEPGVGTVFELSSTGQITTLHIFKNSDGAWPTSAPFLANNGKLYGTTSGGSLGNGGVIYEITPAGAFTTLYNFCPSGYCYGAASPPVKLAQATTGTFVGTAIDIGPGLFGTVFSFSIGLSPLVETVPIAAKPGTRVIILGNDLTGSTSVTFNGTPAEFTVVSDTEITATVPAGATTGPVAVTTLTGTLNSNPELQVLQ